MRVRVSVSVWLTEMTGSNCVLSLTTGEEGGRRRSRTKDGPPPTAALSHTLEKASFSPFLFPTARAARPHLAKHTHTPQKNIQQWPLASPCWRARWRAWCQVRRGKQKRGRRSKRGGACVATAQPAMRPAGPQCGAVGGGRSRAFLAQVGACGMITPTGAGVDGVGAPGMPWRSGAPEGAETFNSPPAPAGASLCQRAGVVLPRAAPRACALAPLRPAPSPRSAIQQCLLTSTPAPRPPAPPNPPIADRQQKKGAPHMRAPLPARTFFSHRRLSPPTPPHPHPTQPPSASSGWTTATLWTRTAASFTWPGTTRGRCEEGRRRRQEKKKAPPWRACRLRGPTFSSHTRATFSLSLSATAPGSRGRRQGHAPGGQGTGE